MTFDVLRHYMQETCNGENAYFKTKISKAAQYKIHLRYSQTLLIKPQNSKITGSHKEFKTDWNFGL